MNNFKQKLSMAAWLSILAVVFAYQNCGDGFQSILPSTSMGSSIAAQITALDKNISTNEDAPISGQLAGVSLKNLPLTFALSVQPKKGSVSINSNGSFTYSPILYVNGNDSFTFRVSDGQLTSPDAVVSIVIKDINHMPIASNGNLNLSSAAPVNGQLAAQDFDKDSLTFEIVGPPSKGSIQNLSIGTGAFSYVPSANVTGIDTFTFRVKDSVSTSNTATMTVNLNAINVVPIAQDITLTTDANMNVAGKLIGTDANNDILSYAITVQPQKGVVQGFNAMTGTFTYVPNINIFGADSFQYVAMDSSLTSVAKTVSINIKQVNLAPLSQIITASTIVDTAIDIEGKATDPDGDALTYAIVAPPPNGSVIVYGKFFRYTPKAGFIGSDMFTYRANDGKIDSNVSQVNISVTAPVIPTFAGKFTPELDFGIPKSLLVSNGNDVYFQADNGTSGVELWRYNSSAKSHQLIESEGGINSAKITEDFSAANGAVAYTTFLENVTLGGATYGIYPDKLYFQSGKNAPVLLVQNDPARLEFMGSRKFVGNDLYFTQLVDRQCFAYRFDGTTKKLIGNVCAFWTNASIIGGKVIFSGQVSLTANSYSLFSYDGTTINLVRDFPGGGPLGLDFFDGNFVYFKSADPTACLLYRSDGTLAGTTALYSDERRDVCYQNNWPVVKAGTNIYSLVSGRLVRVDAAGQALVLRTTGVIRLLGTVGATLFFQDNFISSTDGSVGGTLPFGGFYFFISEPGLNVASINNKLYLRVTNDGQMQSLVEFDSVARTPKLIESNVTIPPVSFGGKIYYAVAGANALDTILKSYDGVTSSIVATLNGSLISGISSFTSGVYFVARDPSSSRQVLWTVMGQSAAPINYFAFVTSNGVPPLNITYSTKLIAELNGVRIYYKEPYLLAINIVTSERKIISAASTNFSYDYPITVNGNLYFTTGNGLELWKTNGTIAGTTRLSTFAQALFVRSLIGDKLIMEGGQSEIFGCDINTGIATKLLDARLVGETGDVRIVNGALYLMSGVAETRIYKTNGTVQGTVELLYIPEQARGMINVGNYLLYYFRSNLNYQIYSVNTLNGVTARIFNSADYSSFIGTDDFDYVNRIHRNLYLQQDGKVYFAANGANGAANSQLWVTDGTIAGTSLITTLPGSLTNLKSAGTKFFFLQKPQGNIDSFNLYISDGTAAGTVLVVNGINPAQSARYGAMELLTRGTKAYFPHTTPANGTELWESDGTALNTKLSIDLYPGAGSSTPDLFDFYGNNLLFEFTSPIYNRKLFFSPLN